MEVDCVQERYTFPSYLPFSLRFIVFRINYSWIKVIKNELNVEIISFMHHMYDAFLNIVKQNFSNF